MDKVCSEDSVRRAFQDTDDAACTDWLTRHVQASYRPLLREPWILEIRGIWSFAVRRISTAITAMKSVPCGPN
jgi:hypothetical protein